MIADEFYRQFHTPMLDFHIIGSKLSTLGTEEPAIAQIIFR
jgi:hypothetical protein